MDQDAAGRQSADAETTPPGRSRTTRRRVLTTAGAGLVGIGLGMVRAGAANATNGDGDDSHTTKGGAALGGGEGYTTVTRPRADIVAETRRGLENALRDATAGDVVFVDGDASLELGDRVLDVPAGVTLASNRGVGGSPGALLRTGAESSGVVRLQAGARLTGVRLRGPRAGTAAGFSARASGVTALGADVEIDNAVVRGFADVGIAVDAGTAHVHHNVIQECAGSTFGEGVAIRSGRSVIEYNYFNDNRHSIATHGRHDGFTCRYNHFGPDLRSHPIDVREPAGTRYHVRRNVVEGFRDPAGTRHPAVALSGVPAEEAAIMNNWFWNPFRPMDTPFETWTDEAIVQPGVGDAWENVRFSGNVYGQDGDPAFADVIPGYDGAGADLVPDDLSPSTRPNADPFGE